MNENAENILLQAQESLSESDGDGAEDHPGTGSDTDNNPVVDEVTSNQSSTDEPDTSADAPDTSADPEVEVLTGEVVSGTLEDPGMEETQKSDISFNVAFLFVLSMIFGLLLFSNLSKKWHA